MDMEAMDDYYMRLALEEAEKAAEEGEIPVGAVLVCDGTVIARGHNSREADRNALAHAEIKVIEEGCRVLGGWRLHRCELYVTLEPCPMCAGAVINSRIKRLVYAAEDKKAGCCGSVTDLFGLPFNHFPEVKKGVMEKEASELLTGFFKELRRSRRDNNE